MRVDHASWPEAGKGRRALAWYLDFLLFGAPWALAVWLLGESVPAVRALSLPLQVVFFLALEATLVRGVGGSPGHRLLGIRRLPPDPLATSDESRSASWVVDPWLKSRERWWTILFGVVAILNGVKTLVRWTMWTPPLPFLGVQLGEGTSVIVSLALGALECAVGAAALRLRSNLLALGVLFYGVSVASVLLGWRLWPAWIERYVEARRTFQGLTVREGEVELLQAVLPAGMVAVGLVLGAWMLAVALRIRRVRTAAGPRPTNES